MKKPARSSKKPSATRAPAKRANLSPAPSRSRARQLRRLAHDLAQVRLASETIPISHGECEQILPWYISDELRGENVRELYPLVWSHLQSCSRCTESYSRLSESLQPMTMAPGATRTPEQPRTPLPFLAPQPGTPWYHQPAVQLIGRKLHSRFEWNPAYLRQALAGATVPGRRAINAPPSESILLSDEIPFGDQLLDVQVTMIPSPHAPDLFHLKVEVQSPTPLEVPVRAHLHWDGADYTAYLSKGETLFEDISPPDFSRPYPDLPSPEFRLQLEAVTDE